MRAQMDRLDARIAGLLSYASQTHLRALTLIGLLASMVALPGLQSLPVTDRDEARYVQASKQMMETGDYIDIRNLDAPRWKKPAGIYWLQVASAKVLGDGADSKIWTYRVPSALGIIAASLLTYWALFPLIGASSALVSGLVVASTATTAVEAHIAKTDAVLLACAVLVFGALIRIYQSRALHFNAAHWLLWIGLGLGFLIKGPIILIPFIGALIWVTIAERSASLLRAIAPLKGFVLFAVIAAPWYVAIALKTDGAFFAESLGKDLLGKVGQASEKHDGPFGYYLMTMWVTFWPWAPLALLAIPMAWTSRKTPELRLLVGWIIPCWAVFALTSTKLPHYVLPVLPAMAALIGMSLSVQSPKWLRILASFLFVIGSVGTGFFALGPLPVLENQLPLSLIIAGLLIFALFLLATLALLGGRTHAFAALGVATLLIMFPTLTMITAPRAQTLFLSPRLAAIHDTFNDCAPQPLLSSGYSEMSLAFLTETTTRFVSREHLAAHLATSPSAHGLLRVSDADALEQVQTMAGIELEVFASIFGTNYNSGREVVIGLIGPKDTPALEDCAANVPGEGLE